MLNRLGDRISTSSIAPGWMEQRLLFRLLKSHSRNMSSLTDLFEFLHSPNPDARQLALSNLVGHTPKNAPNRAIFVPRTAAALDGRSGGGLGQAGGMDEAEKARREMIEDLKVLCRDQAVSARGRMKVASRTGAEVRCATIR